MAEFEEEDEDDGAGWGSGVHAEGSIYSDHPHTPGSQEDSQDSADQDVPETEDDEDDEADDEERGRGGLGKRGAAIRPIRTVAPVVRTESCLSLMSLLVRWVVACPVSVRGRCLIGAACGVCAGWQGGVAALPVQGGPLLWRHGAHATGTSGGRHGRRREACGRRHREGEQRHPQVRLGPSSLEHSGPVSGLLTAWLCCVPRVPRHVVVGSCASPVPSLPVAFATLRPLSRTALRDSDLFGKLAPNTPPAHEQANAKHDAGQGREDDARPKHAARTSPIKASHDKAQAAAAARWGTSRV